MNARTVALLAQVAAAAETHKTGWYAEDELEGITEDNSYDAWPMFGPQETAHISEASPRVVHELCRSWQDQATELERLRAIVCSLVEEDAERVEAVNGALLGCRLDRVGLIGTSMGALHEMRWVAP